MDRNTAPTSLSAAACVALHPEGVDRNWSALAVAAGNTLSPSTRRAWIEIAKKRWRTRSSYVALHPEGVDRNMGPGRGADEQKVALHPEGVDRNLGAFAMQEAPMVALHPEGVDRNSPP